LRYLLHEPLAIGTARPAELWVALHGATGTAEQGLELFGKAAAARQTLLLACEASRPLGDGFAWAFARDLASIMQIIDAIETKYYLGKPSIGLCGFSMGCTMGLWLLANYPGRFRFFVAVSIGSAFEPWELDDGGIDESGLRQAAMVTPIFLSVDKHDPYGCTPYFEQNLAKLRNLGFRVQPFTPHEQKHWVTDLVTKEYKGWLDTI
jgi:pimeloyl-ACP methyl ester carboxylesterase